MTRHDPRSVRAHYAELAESYDRGANRACKHAYQNLVAEKLVGSTRVLELGAGSTPLAPILDAPHAIACDLSPAMLSRADVPNRVVADGMALPFRDAAFDTLFSINVLEHVPDVAALFQESARVLAPGGRLLAVTPNGDVAWLLETLERLHLKLPEGPHQFLGRAALLAHAERDYDLLEHRRFLAFPAGPPAIVSAIDSTLGTGLFQYVLLRKRG